MGEEERARGASQVSYGELPELTRALRALGSARLGGTSQALFFNPLLEARRRAADARTPHARVRAFDATDLRRALERAVERIIAEWPDNRVSVRRALRAELVDRVRSYSEALVELSRRAAAVLDADGEDQLEVWRAWTGQLGVVFAAADRTWLSLRSAVDAIPKAKP
jgi:hypothetical protein